MGLQVTQLPTCSFVMLPPYRPLTCMAAKAWLYYVEEGKDGHTGLYSCAHTNQQLVFSLVAEQA